ncbi:MAG: tetratricopeptide repeat protein [Planctomycetes bacterium]|nr:tetratricopeptide repeat protein [Planctomycetota bacterium]
MRLVAENQGGGDIWHDIEALIARAAVVVADFASDVRSRRAPNPNVITEATIARFAYGHEQTLLLASHAGAPLPASWNRFRTTFYDPAQRNLAVGSESLAERLTRRIEAALHAASAGTRPPPRLRPGLPELAQVLLEPALVLFEKVKQAFAADPPDRAKVRDLYRQLVKCAPPDHPKVAPWGQVLADWTKEAEEAIERGSARQEQGNLAGAVSDYTRAIELDPNYALAYSNRGATRADQGDLAGAVSDYNRAFQLDRNLAVAYAKRPESLGK